MLQAALSLSIESWLPAWRDPEFGDKVVRLQNQISSSPEPPFTIVMVGSSRTLFGFQAELLNRSLSQSMERPVVVFNFGTTGAGPLLQLVNLNRLLARGVHPDLLLVEVLPPSLDGHYTEVGKLPPQRLWRRDLPVVERYGGSASLRSDWWTSLLVPWYGHRFVIVSRLLPELLPDELRKDWARGIDASGWLAASTADPLTAEQHMRATQFALRDYGASLQSFHLGGPSCQALREMLELCRSNKVATTLVLMPESETFRALYPPAALLQIRDFMTELSRTYGTPVIDARGWVAEDGFWDSHHLLPGGAGVFTERLCSVLHQQSRHSRAHQNR